MSIHLERAAHFYAQHEYGQTSWRQTVSRGEFNERTIQYVAVPSEENVTDHFKDTLVVRSIDDDSVEIEISPRIAVETAAILAQTAFSEIAKARGDIRTIARVPFDIENPEKSLSTAEIFVDTLQMQGDRFTDDGKFIYTGSARESLGAVEEILKWRLGRRIMRSLYLPDVA